MDNFSMESQIFPAASSLTFSDEKNEGNVSIVPLSTEKINPLSETDLMMDPSNLLSSAMSLIEIPVQSTPRPVINLSCDICGEIFTLKKNVLRHKRSKHDNISIDCLQCGHKFSRLYHLRKHLKNKVCLRQKERKILKENISKECQECGRGFTRLDSLHRHLKSKTCILQKEKALNRKQNIAETTSPLSEEKIVSPISPKPIPTPTRSAFGGLVEDYFLHNTDGFLEIDKFLQSKKDDFYNIISSKLQQYELKVNVKLICLYERYQESEILRLENIFKTKMTLIQNFENIQNIYNSFIEDLLIDNNNFQQDSGWTLSNIIALEIKTHKFSSF